MRRARSRDGGDPHTPATGVALGAAAIVLAGCTTTVRAAIGPTVDTGGKAGAVGTLSLGFGFPVDFGKGRSHHYVQVLGGVGGGRDGATGGGMVAAALDVDHIYWNESRFDTRAGLHLAYQGFPDKGTARYGGGAHAAIVPMVYQDDRSWLVTQVCVGPELRADVLSGNAGNNGGALGVFSLPLLVELNFLPAGD
jgi:hypothetical protein